MVRSSKRHLSYGGHVSRESSSAVVQVCTLCKVHHQHMSEVQTWQSQQARDNAAKCGILSGDLVCHPCRDDLHRISANASHIPRWKKKNPITDKCCVRGCSDICFAHSKMQIFTTPTAEQLKDIDIVLDENMPSPTPLCNHHYHTLYHMIQPHQTNCATCGVSLKHVTSRTCPNAAVIRKHLCDSAAFEGTLKDGDRVCYACYKSYLVILQEEKMLSKDSNLQYLPYEIREKIFTATPSTRQLAMDKTVVYVGKQLLQGMALLLLDALDFFLEAYCDDDQQEPDSKVSSIWLLSNLMSALHTIHIQDT